MEIPQGGTRCPLGEKKWGWGGRGGQQGHGDRGKGPAWRRVCMGRKEGRGVSFRRSRCTQDGPDVTDETRSVSSWSPFSFKMCGLFGAQASAWASSSATRMVCLVVWWLVSFGPVGVGLRWERRAFARTHNTLATPQSNTPPTKQTRTEITRTFGCKRSFCFPFPSIVGWGGKHTVIHTLSFLFK